MASKILSSIFSNYIAPSLTPRANFMQDFRGQKDAELFYQAFIIIVSFFGFVHGYFAQSFEITFKYWFVATAIALFVVIPGWPFLFKRNPVKWRDEDDSADDVSSSISNNSRNSQKE